MDPPSKPAAQQSPTTRRLHLVSASLVSVLVAVAFVVLVPLQREPDGVPQTMIDESSTEGLLDSSARPAKPTDDVRLTLVFEESFDTMDRDRWKAESSTFGDGNNELQCYVPELASVRNGVLTLRARQKQTRCPSGESRPVASGMVRSSGITFEPGQRVEFRARLVVADTSDMGGLWPALWAAGWNDAPWPAGGEIDMLEWISRRSARSVYSAHWQGADGEPARWSASSSHNLANQWHTYAFEWTTSELRWFADGRLVARADPSTFITDGPNPYTDPQNKIDQFRINLALGGDWGGPLGSTAIDSAGSTSFEVDYLRIYDLSE